MLTYNDLTKLAAKTIRAGLVAKSVAITPKMESLLVTLDTNPGCWKAIFTSLDAWSQTASTAETASLWQSIVDVCKEDGRPYAAYPILHLQQNNAAALNGMWEALPPDALPTLREAVAANPLVTSTPEAKAKWPKLLDAMKKLSLHGTYVVDDQREMLDIIRGRVPHLSATRQSDLVTEALAVLHEDRHKGQTKLHGAKMAIARSQRRSHS